MNKFKPSLTYDGLLIQARALHSIAANSEKAASAMYKMLLESERTNKLNNDCESIRNTNEILTNENESLQRRVDELEIWVAAIVHDDSVPDNVRSSACDMFVVSHMIKGGMDTDNILRT